MTTVRAAVVYESMFGNTREIADAVALGLGDADVRVWRAGDFPDRDVAALDLLVIGGPTHMLGTSAPATRQLAIDAARRPGSPRHLEPHAGGPGVRELVQRLCGEGRVAAAAFDTRLRSSLSGRAASHLSRRLEARGFRIVFPPVSFFVDRNDVLLPGELIRARTWGRRLATRMARRAPSHRAGSRPVAGKS